MKYQGHVSQKMGVFWALVFHKHILFQFQITEEKMATSFQLYIDKENTPLKHRGAKQPLGNLSVMKNFIWT